MRERIARAAWEANRARAAGIVELAPWEDENEALHADWLAFADAALDALREPSEAMLLAGAKAGVDQIYYKQNSWERCVADEFKGDHLNYVKYAFEATIDAAKEER